ncbi:hypothetical protein [Prevotella sp. KH2C16]|uniref:hypothetical protein n=1 Tax=Prevotella sp. KH2C16 TaxID=1855325 RepID=UPI0008EB2480|nr:hypothetical protein [Prevotella sp. KH2C16]SFG78338.1 hypothetical protein SAMN05216383_1502 [Prevotella sp. KH2C16]
MRNLIIILLLLTSIRSYSQIADRVDRIFILYAGWDKLTDTNVSCMNYESHFGKGYYSVNNKTLINKFLKVALRLKKSDKRFVDVRCKVYCHMGDTIISSLCIDRDYVLFDGSYYRNSKKLRRIIKELISGGCPKGNFIKEHNENKIIGGKYALEQYILGLIKEKKLEGVCYIKGYCTANQDGKTIKVVLRAIYSGGSITSRVDLGELEDFYQKHIWWNPCKERMIMDLIPINIKIRSDTKLHIE